MDALKGSDLVAAFAECQDRYGSSGLVNLTTLDLRGCKKLDSSALLAIIRAAPNLRIVNLKGVQAVSSEVIRSLARTSTQLESLDVSRCWDISLCDICVFVKMLSDDQADRLRVLRVGGMKAYGTTGADFLPLVFERLVKLETLDLLGCTHIFDPDLIRACESLTKQSRQSSLHHLILSGCSSLSHAIFPAMRNVFPHITRFELASIPEMFDGSRDGEAGLQAFLRSLPNLQKLDLDGTGTNGGVNDKILVLLTPPKGETNALTDLRIGYAKNVTPEGLIRFIRGCTTLRHFEADVSVCHVALNVKQEVAVLILARTLQRRMQSCESFTAATTVMHQSRLSIAAPLPRSHTRTSRHHPDHEMGFRATLLFRWRTTKASWIIG